MVSLLLKVLIGAYFCMQLLAVVNYGDPSISSYTLLDSRDSMTEPINLKDFGVQLYFYLANQHTARPAHVGPEIGKLELYSSIAQYKPEGGLQYENIKLDYEEVDFMKQNDTVIWYNNTPTRWVMQPSDHSQLQLRGLWESPMKQYVNITFSLCKPSAS